MWFILGIVGGLILGIYFQPQVLKIWEWVKTFFQKK
jgi:uncharacterized protein with PQ loop repeat